MKAQVLCALTIATSICTSNALAQDRGGTKFRGISLNQSLEMTREGLKANGFDLQSTDRSSSTIKRGNQECGSIKFDAAGLSETLRLEQCYFAASGMNMKELAQAIVNNYPVQRLEPQTIRTPMCTMTLYKGTAKTGELVGILDACGTSPPFVSIERVLSADKPKFN